MAITDPRDISGLVGWYSPEAETGYADNATMTGLSDRSGAGNHATAVNGTPKWRSANGRSGGASMEFAAGVSFALPNLLSGASAVEVFMLVKNEGSGADAGMSRIGSSTDVDHYPFSGSIYNGVGSTTRKGAISPGTQTVTAWRRIDIWSAAADWEMLSDEVSLHSTSTNTVGLRSDPVLGNYWGGTTLGYGAVLFYTRKLTTGERADVISWLTSNPSGGVPVSSVSLGTLPIAGSASVSAALKVEHRLAPTFLGSATVSANIIGDGAAISAALSATASMNVAIAVGNHVVVTATVTATAALGATLVVFDPTPAGSPVMTAVLVSNELPYTPGGLSVTIGGGVPADVVSFSAIGPTTSNDFYLAALDSTGAAMDLVVTLPPLTAGSYLLRVASGSSGSIDIAFTVLDDPLSFDGTEPKPAPVPPTTAPVQRWRLYDLVNPAVNWTMPHNPATWRGIHEPNHFTHENTTAQRGQILTWQAANRPWQLEFTGFLWTQSHYEQLVFWSELRRRFWLVDHRNRPWLVTFEHLDVNHRIVPGVPWAHDYTVRALVFRAG